MDSYAAALTDEYVTRTLTRLYEIFGDSVFVAGDALDRVPAEDWPYWSGLSGYDAEGLNRQPSKSFGRFLLVNQRKGHPDFTIQSFPRGHAGGKRWRVTRNVAE